MVASISETGPSAGESRSVGNRECSPPGSCLNCVGASALGAELTPEELHTLRGLVDVQMLSKGDVLISEGEQNDRLYAIAAGEMEITRRGDGGRDVSLQRLEPGSLTGELAFIEGLKRTATVRARKDCCVVSIGRHQLEALLPDHPWLAYKVMRAVVRSAHRTVGSLDTAYTDFVRYVSS